LPARSIEPVTPPTTPKADSWIAAIHRFPDDEPFASGVLIDGRRVLTCAHVLTGAASVVVSFPKAEGSAGDATYSVADVVLPEGHGAVKDVAILVLKAPVGVTAAPLRCPKPGDLVDGSWWAFGFPVGEPLGNTASGQVGSALGHGWVLLNTASRYPVATGFSGSGLWSPEYQAVVALVGQANGANGDGLAITLHQADQWLAGQGLRTLAERVSLPSAGEVALSAWGARFCGRTAAMEAIVGWLDRDAVDRRVLVVTGNPGSGKSAVLGRVVTTADPDAGRQHSDTAVRATVGSVACAVHAKGLTALEVARQIAKAASAHLPERLEDFAPAVCGALTERAGTRFNVVIDALDEAATPAEARLVVSKVITPLAETSTDARARVLVGTRRADADGDLLASLAGAAKLVDLDDPGFFDTADLASYALATLRLSGDERPASPYAADAVAIPVADRIAALAGNNFLVAGLTARTHGLYDEVAPDPAALSFSPKVDDAMREYLNRVQPAGEVSAVALLTALAFAESPGLPLPLWRVAVRALGVGEISEAALLRFARSSGTSFLVESSDVDGADGAAVFRLFHQALNDALLRTRASAVPRAADERSLAQALIAYGRESGWQNAPKYLLRSLPGHAKAGGLIDDLLGDDAYLLHADLRRLLRAVGGAGSPAGRRRARLLRLTPLAVTASPAARAAMFSVTEALERIGDTYSRAGDPVPYRAAWAAATPRSERSVLVGHTARVQSVCALAMDGRTYLASGGEDRTVRIWDPETGTQRTVLKGHQSEVNAVCAFTLDGTAMLASVGGDRVVRIWNAETGGQELALKGHTGWIASICSFVLDGRPLLATGGYDQTVRIWDPEAGTLRLTLHGHTDRVTSVCALALDDRTLLASGSRDGTVRIWEPATGERWPVVLRNPNYSDWVHAVAAFTLAGRQLLAIAGAGQVLRILDLMTGLDELALDDCAGTVRSLAAFSLDGAPALAGGDDRTVRIWDLVTGERSAQHGHTGTIRSVCPFTLNGAALVATAGDDWTVRIWNPGSDAFPPPETWESDEVTAVCALAVGGVPLLAVANGDSAVRAVDPADGQRRDFPANVRGGTAISAFSAGEHPVLITADYDQTVRLWDLEAGTHKAIQPDGMGTILVLCAFTLSGRPVIGAVDSQRSQTVQIRDLETGTLLSVLETYPSRIRSLGAVSLHGGLLLAAGGADGAIRLWNPEDQAQRASLKGHDGWVNAVCAFEFGDHVFLASGGHDRTVQIWDLEKMERALTIPVHHPVNALSFVNGLLVVGTTAGLLALRLNTDLSSAFLSRDSQY
jgi:WD40 repeat protein